MSSAVVWPRCCFVVVVLVACASPIVGRRCVGGLRSVRSVDADVHYAVVIDAGSSGSRVRVYRWPESGDGEALMAGVQSIKPTLKIRTGLAQIADNETGVRYQIGQLINNASGHIPLTHHDVTPIYFMATAGPCQNSQYFTFAFSMALSSLESVSKFSVYR